MQITFASGHTVRISSIRKTWRGVFSPQRDLPCFAAISSEYATKYASAPGPISAAPARSSSRLSLPERSGSPPLPYGRSRSDRR